MSFNSLLLAQDPGGSFVVILAIAAILAAILFFGFVILFVS
jgi:hypothetical protein